jgi:hypothetical protein
MWNFLIIIGIHPFVLLTVPLPPFYVSILGFIILCGSPQCYSEVFSQCLLGFLLTCLLIPILLFVLISLMCFTFSPQLIMRPYFLNFDKIFWSHGLLIKLKARISKRLIYGEIFKPFTLTLEILDFLFFTLTELFNSFFGLSEKALANLLIVSLFSLVAFSQYKLCIYIVVNDWESQPPLR